MCGGSVCCGCVRVVSAWGVVFVFGVCICVWNGVWWLCVCWLCVVGVCGLCFCVFGVFEFVGRVCVVVCFVCVVSVGCVCVRVCVCGLCV